jgi:hypothetical protein
MREGLRRLLAAFWGWVRPDVAREYLETVPASEALLARIQTGGLAHVSSAGFEWSHARRVTR